MPTERTIPTTTAKDLVSFTLLVNGTELGQEYEVMGLQIEKVVSKIPRAYLVLRDGNVSKEDFPISNEDTFVPGSEIEIKLGYHSDEETAFKGVIIKHGIKIKQSGTSILKLECVDQAVEMTIGHKRKYFETMKDSEIIESLISDNSLESDVEATTVTHPELVQFESTDWDFINARAESNGQVVIVNDGKIEVKVPDTSSAPVLELQYGATMYSFEAEMNAEKQWSSVKSQSWNAVDQEVIETEAADPGITEAGDLTGQELSSALNEGGIILSHGGKVEQDELQAWADGELLRSRLSKIRGTVSCSGFSAIKPGDMIKLEGVGERFSGNVFVSGVSHNVTEGTWISTIQFGLNADCFAERHNITAIPSSGLLPAIQGLQVGVVVALEGDPDGQERIQVKVPVIDNEAQGIWTRIATLDAGENRGMVFRPEIDDEVIIGFINDDPRDAVMLGQLHSAAKPSPIAASDDNHEKGYVSRSEMKLTFNDDESSITVETPNGNLMRLSDDDGGITLEDENGNKIVMNSDGIAIESSADISVAASSGDMKSEAINIEFDASASFKGKGGASAEIEGSGSAALKGGVVQIN